MKVAELVGRTLAQLGVGHVFGVVGSGNFAVTNALRDHGVPFTAARHEGGAATMADAFSRMSEQVAVVSTHQGCGLTNAMTGIAEAAKSRTPMIVVAADSAASAVRSNFKVDQDALAHSVGATAERVHSPESAIADTVRAYRTAVNERRTVVLNLPLDVQEAAVPEGALDAVFHAVAAVAAPQAVRPNADVVAKLADLITTAHRPVFIAGRGARAAGAELAELAARCGALVATSAVASGLFENEEQEFALGISGGFSTPTTAELIRGADLLIGWGCTLNMWTTRHGRLIGDDAVLVQVDVDDAALGVNRPIHLGVLGDVGETARALLERTQSHGVPGADGARLDASGRRQYDDASAGYRTADVAKRIADGARWRDVDTDDLSDASLIDPRVLTRRLDELLPAERVVAVDSGNFMGYPSAYLSVPDQFGFCFTQAFQSIGLGLHTAIGAALAKPDRLPVLAAGDGGFLMSISELETAVRLRLPLVAIVYNDNAYGAEVHHFGAHADLETVVFPDTDIAAIARGYGATGVTVRTVDDLRQVEDWLAGPRNAPLVIDAKVANDGGSWWLAEAFGH
jgi:thiamine pyrophosphate-dependent acetolactate synthase large subunit-like protein